MRAIDGDKIVKILNECIDKILAIQGNLEMADNPKLSVELQVYKDMLDEINEMPTIEPEPPWISCEERLPEDGERVLATHLGGLNPDRQVIEHIYKNGKFTLGWDMDMNMDSPTFGLKVSADIQWLSLAIVIAGAMAGGD